MKLFKRFLLLTIAFSTCFMLAGCSIIDKIKEYIPGQTTNQTTKAPQNQSQEGIVYDDFQVHFLELGNEYTGDSVYIKAGENDILIDAGSRQNSAIAIKNAIDKYCTDGKLEYVISTHAHQDHIAGFVGTKDTKVKNERTGILYQYDIGTLIDFDKTNSTTTLYSNYLAGVEFAVSNGTIHKHASDYFTGSGESAISKGAISLGNDISMEIIWNKYYFETSKDENNHSVCTLFKYKDHNFFFTGDLEKEGEEEIAKYYDKSSASKTLPKVDLFKAGHHGSKTSSNDCLLEIIQPDICCICACAGSSEYTANNNNMFPTQDFIDRISKYTDAVYVTSVLKYNSESEEWDVASMNGEIIVSCNGTDVAIAASNNLIKLKDTEWFNEKVYVDASGNMCPKSGSDEFFTKDTSGVTEVPRRVWKGSK